MEAVYEHADESKLKYNIPKGQPLHQVWNSLWEQCEEANERSNSKKTCFPRASNNLANIMKMLTVFQSEVKERSSNSEYISSNKNLCENCGSGKSKQKLLQENFSRSEIIEYLLSADHLAINEGLKHQTYQPYLYKENLGVEKPNGTKELTNKRTTVISHTQIPEVAEIPLIRPTSFVTKGSNNLFFHPLAHKDNQEENQHGTIMQGFKPDVTNTVKLSGYNLERETQSKENITRTLVKLLKNFTKYDPNKDPFTNMSVFENECSQHNLGPRESCLMMKLWLPSQMSARLSAPVAAPAGGLQFWSNDYHWGDALDRVKALTHLVTGEDNLGPDILEDLNVTSQDDPWVFARKFEQAYRLTMDFQDPKPSPALLKALINKFNYVDRATRLAASKEKTIEGIVSIVNNYQKDNGLKAAPLWKNEVSPVKEVEIPNSIPKDEQPIRWRE